MPSTMSSNQARQRWSHLLNTASQGRTTVIERYGGPIAVLVPYYEWTKQNTNVRHNEPSMTTEVGKLTEALNQVYDIESSTLDPALAHMQTASLDGETW